MSAPPATIGHMNDSSIAIYLIIALALGAAIGFFIGHLKARSAAGSRIASLEATSEAEKANVARLEAQLAARIEEEKSAL